jgi:ElaB/YqjD/DUF883 family membrane-anchored ribosome-binding protein
MDNSELRDTLEKLHRELEHTENIDEESLQRLQHLANDIQEVLDREEPSSAEENESLGGQLNEAIQEYEVSHPELTNMLRYVMDILSGAGI